MYIDPEQGIANYPAALGIQMKNTLQCGRKFLYVVALALSVTGSNLLGDIWKEGNTYYIDSNVDMGAQSLFIDRNSSIVGVGLPSASYTVKTLSLELAASDLIFGTARASTPSFTLESPSIFFNGSRKVTLYTDVILRAPILSDNLNWSLTVAGTGTLRLTSPMYYEGGAFNILKGATVVAESNATGLSKIKLDGHLRFLGGSVSNDISGTGTVTYTPSGQTFGVFGNNSYSGGTIIESGRLWMGNSKALGTGSLTMKAGALDMSYDYTNTRSIVAESGTLITIGSMGATSVLTINSSLNSLINGALDDGVGRISLVKAGSGALTLGGDNNHSGGTTLKGGTLDLNHTNALGRGALTISAPSVIDNTSGAGVTLTPNNTQYWNANLTFKGTNDLNLGTGGIIFNGPRTIAVTAGTLTIGGAIDPNSPAGSSLGLTKTGKGTLLLTDTFRATGTLTVSEGTLQLGNGGTGGYIQSNSLVNNGTVVINRSNEMTLAALMSGKGAFRKEGAGLLNLTQANTYSGGTNINGGEVALWNNSSLGAATGNLAVNAGGTLDLNGRYISVGALSGDGKITNYAWGSSSLTTTTSANTIYSGTLHNQVSLIKSGTGTLTLAGENLHVGTTQLLSGGLNLNHESALGWSTFIIGGVSTIDNTSGSALTLNMYNILKWNADFTFKGTNDLHFDHSNVDMSGTRTINVAAKTLTLSGTIAGIGATDGLIKTGAGTLELAGNNTYTGATTIKAGTLKLSGWAGTMGSSSIRNDARLLVTTSLDYAGVISGTGSLVNDGGQLFLSGKNTYTGGTTIRDGRIILGHNDALGRGDLTVYSDGELDLNGHNITVNTLSAQYDSWISNYTSTKSSITINGSGNSIMGGDMNFNYVDIIKSGTGTLYLSGTNFTDGGLVLQSGAIVIDTRYIGLGHFTIGGVSTIDAGGTTPGALDWSTPLFWNANFTFKGSNDLDMGRGDVLMNGARTVTVNAKTLTVRGNISATKPTFGLTKAGKGTLVLTGNSTYTGATAVTAGTLQIGDGGNTGSISSTSLVNNGTVIFNRWDSLAYNGVISGTGSLVKQGYGNLHLGGANKYSGGTVISDGGITLGSATALGSATGSLAIDYYGTLDLNGYNLSIGALSGNGSIKSTPSLPGSIPITLATNSAQNSTFSGTIAGAGLSLIKTGVGTLTLSGDNTYTGGTTLLGGGLNINNANALGSGELKIAAASTLDNTSGSAIVVNNGNAQTWSSGFTFKGTNDLYLGWGSVLMTAARGVSVTVIAGKLTVGGSISANSPTIGLTKAGKGTLVLADNSTYTGSTIVSAGTLQIGNGGNFGSIASSSLVNNGIVIFSRMNSAGYNGIISGAGSIVKSSNGVLTLNGINTYTGGTIVEDGRLAMGNAKALGGSSSSLTVNGRGILDMNGHDLTIGTLSGNGKVASEKWVPENDAPGTPPSAPLTPVTLTINSSLNSDFSGGIYGPDLTLVKSGSGTLTLRGNSHYEGGTILNAGGVNINASAALGHGPVTIAGTVVLDNTSDSTVNFYGNYQQNWNANFTFKGTRDLNLGKGQVTMNATRTVTVNAGKLTVGGIISAPDPSFGLIKAGKGTLILSGNSRYTGTTTVSAGTLQIGDGDVSGSITSSSLVNNGTVAFARRDTISYGGIISGAGSVVKTGAGTLTLNGVNKYAGGTIIDKGTLVIGNSSALGSPIGSLTINNDANLNLNGNSISIGALSGYGQIFSGQFNEDLPPVTLTLNSAANSTFLGWISAQNLTLIKSGTGTITLRGTNLHRGGTILNAGGVNINNHSALGMGTLTIAGVVTLDNTSDYAIQTSNIQHNWNANFTFKGTNDLNLGEGSVFINAARTVTVSAGKLTVGGGIHQVGPKALSFTKAGNGTLILAGDSSYTGTTTVSAGTLQIGTGSYGGSIASTSLVNNGVVSFNRQDSISYGGAISGKGVVQKNGLGELTLSGVNSHTGGTVLNTGTLLVGSATALGRGAVTLNGGLLGTTGGVSRINIISHLYWDGDATISLSLDPTGGSELVAVGGKLVMLDDGPLTFDLDFSKMPTSTSLSYLLMTVAGGFGNLTADSFAFTSNYSSLEGQFRIDAKTESLYFDATNPAAATTSILQRSATHSDEVLTSIQAVPEPSTWMLIALGGFLLAWRTKRLRFRA